MLALAGLALAFSCDGPRSLVRVYIDGDREYRDVTVLLRATDATQDGPVTTRYPGQTVPIRGADPLKIGMYLPPSMHGAITVRGAAQDASCEIAVGESTVPSIQSGQVVTINISLNAQSCVPLGDGGVPVGSGGAPGSGGSTGSGGASGSDGSAGGGGAEGSGGMTGSGGAAGSGGMTGSGGAAGSGGMTGSGGADAAIDVPPDVPPCQPESEARTCGSRCNIDVMNNCGDPVHCGGCASAGDMCGNATTPNFCVPCEDPAQVCRNLECGVVTDACGRRISCGVCNFRQVCCAGVCTQPFRCQIVASPVTAAN